MWVSTFTRQEKGWHCMYFITFLWYLVCPSFSNMYFLWLGCGHHFRLNNPRYIYNVWQFKFQNANCVALWWRVIQPFALHHVLQCFNSHSPGLQTSSLSLYAVVEGIMCVHCAVRGEISDRNLEQWVNIEILRGNWQKCEWNFSCYKSGEHSMKKSSAFERFWGFKEGQEDVDDDARSGQPKTQRMNANVGRVQTLVCSFGCVFLITGG